MVRALFTINALVAEKELAMLDGGYQLLPHDMATKSLQLARTQLANAGSNALMLKENLDALAAALEIRIRQPCQYTATNLEACSDVIGFHRN